MLKKVLLLAAVAHPVAFHWKVDAENKLVTDANGNPIYVDTAGQELVTEASTIARLNAEAKQHRVAREKAEKDLKQYEGLDAAKAREALETVSQIDAKKLIDAGQVEQVKRQMAEQYEKQLSELQASNTNMQLTLDNMTKSRAFDKSDFIRNRIAVPPEMFEATFGNQFKVEGGKVVPYGRDGNVIYSRKRMGEVADVDEAFEIIVEAYPHKDAILKAIPAGGTGGQGAGGQRVGMRMVRRADFDAMTPVQKAQVGQAIAKGEISIVE